jgi:pilus assembly protein CpaE
MRVLHLPGTILLVSSGTLVCARDVARLKEKIGPNSAERASLHILNKSAASESLSAEEFAGACGSPPDIVIPYAREIAVASRLGVQGLQKCAALQHGLLPLFRQISGEEPAAAKRSRLRELFG